MDIGNSSSTRSYAIISSIQENVLASQTSETTHSLLITASMLPILDPTQLDLPFDPLLSSDLHTDNTVHKMNTRLQIVTIQKE